MPQLKRQCLATSVPKSQANGSSQAHSGLINMQNITWIQQQNQNFYWQLILIFNDQTNACFPLFYRLSPPLFRSLFSPLCKLFDWLLLMSLFSKHNSCSQQQLLRALLRLNRSLTLCTNQSVLIIICILQINRKHGCCKSAFCTHNKA